MRKEAYFIVHEDFPLLLQKATGNDISAIYEIMQAYESLIIKNSYINGRFDEDCRAYIELKLITAIKNFKI